MIPAIERKYRAILLMERIQQIAGELMVLEEETPAGPEQQRVHAAFVAVCKSSDALQTVPTVAEDLEAMLQQSIDNIGERKNAERILAKTILPFRTVVP